MATETRLRWAGNQQAQADADRAYLEFKQKAAARKYIESLKPKKLSKGQKRKRRKLRKLQTARQPAQFKRPDYHVYIESKAWRARRKQYYDRHGKQCEVCGSTDAVQLHHRHYNTLGREKDKDLQALCRGCHENHHEADGKTTDPMTREFLALEL